jgi:hypothetical protein
MTTRRKLFIMVATAAPFVAIAHFSRIKPPEKVMVTASSLRPRGPANRSLAALERSWVETRFYSEAMMEEGRVPRDHWVKAKFNVIHGNFDIRDPDNGALLQKVVNGVRTMPPAP